MRLTNDIRQKIISNAINSTLGKEDSRISEREKKLADAVYFDSFSKSTLKAVNDIPDGWINVQQRIVTLFGGNVVSLKMSEPRRIPLTDPWGLVDSWGVAVKKYSKKHRLSRRYFDIQSKRKELEKKKREAWNMFGDMFKNVRTLNQLQKAWPESVNFLDGVKPDMPSSSSVNELLGIK